MKHGLECVMTRRLGAFNVCGQNDHFISLTDSDAYLIKVRQPKTYRPPSFFPSSIPLPFPSSPSLFTRLIHKNDTEIWPLTIGRVRKLRFTQQAMERIMLEVSLQDQTRIYEIRRRTGTTGIAQRVAQLIQLMIV